MEEKGGSRGIGRPPRGAYSAYTPENTKFLDKNEVQTGGYSLARKDLGAGFTPVKRELVAISDRNGRMGETHPNALYTDAWVEMVRDRYEDGAPPDGEPRTRYNSVGYKRLAKEFGVSVSVIRQICTYNRRAAWADRWKRL